MPWKTIKGIRYYYKYRRVGGRVVSECAGSGLAAAVIAELDRYEADERARARAEERQRLEALAEADRGLAAYHGGVQLVFVLAMEAAGFRRHQRGDWRRRRFMVDETKSEAPAPIAARKWSHAEMKAVLMRGADGDETARAEIQELHKSDWGPEIVRVTGDPETILIDALIARIANSRTNITLNEVMRRRVEDVRRGLTPADATPLEKLLVGRVALGWLAVTVAEDAAVSRSAQASAREKDVLDRLASRAHLRLLQSIRALTAIRKPDAPGVALQVNVGVSRPPDPGRLGQSSVSPDPAGAT